MARLILAASLLFVASAGASELAARSVSELGGLLARQTTGLDPSSVPTQCQSACSAIVTTLNDATCSTNLQCLCSSSNARGLEACVNCLVNLSPTAAMVQQGQTILNNYVSACRSVTSIPPLSVGGSATSASSSAAGIPTSGLGSPSFTTSGFNTITSLTSTRPLTTTGAQQTITANDGGSSGGSSGSDNPLGLNGATGVHVSHTVMAVVGIIAGAGFLFI